MINYNNYLRLENESFDEYCHRMGSKVRLEEQLTWKEVADIINQVCELSYSETWYRKREKNYISFDDMDPVDQVYQNEKFKLAKERVKLSDERIQVNALIRRLAREDTLKEIAETAVEAMNSKKKLKYCPPINIPKAWEGGTQGLLLISDWHYGIAIENKFNIFNPTVAEERIQSLLNKTIDKCKQLNIDILNIANLGDMIAGNIHLPLRINSRIDVITQVIEVSELLCEFLNELSNKFTINYYGVLDNHSRIDPKKFDSIDLESLSRIINWYVVKRLPQINTCLSEENFASDICNTNILGHNIALIHGHKDSQASAIKKLNNFSARHYDLICSAHMHHFSADEECGTLLISNGSLMGTDDYAYNLRLHATPSQTLIEINEGNVAAGIYKFNL